MSTAADNGVNDTTRKNLILNYCFIALSGLVLYEYIITISDEIQLFWDRRPTTWSFFLFTSNRLIMIGLVVTGALTVAPADRVTSCKAISLPYGILQLATYTLWAVVSTLRVYALSRHSRHSWYLSTATLGTGLVPLGINIFDLVKLTYSVLPGTNECQDIYNYSNALPPGDHRFSHQRHGLRHHSHCGDLVLHLQPIPKPAPTARSTITYITDAQRWNPVLHNFPCDEYPANCLRSF